MVSRRPPRPCHWTAPPGKGCQLVRPDSVSALASDPHTAGADPAGLVWSEAALTCAASGSYGGIWYALEALRRCDTLQRGAGGIIVACVGLVSAVLEWGKSQETPL